MGERFSDFDAMKAGEALGVEPHAVRDVAHGAGEALTTGDTTIEVFPGAGVARVTTTDARIELFRVPEYSITRERVVFEQGDQDDRSRLQVRADGKVAFHPVLRAAEQPQAVEGVAGGRPDVPAPVMTSEGSTAAPDGTALSSPKEDEIQAQQLTGRLGRDPWYNAHGDQPVAGFPLAVNDDRGQTTWHRVVVFGETADQVKAALQTGQIRKGRLVQLSGSEVVRNDDNGRGGTRKSTEFHATSVTRLKNTTVPHPQSR